MCAFERARLKWETGCKLIFDAGHTHSLYITDLNCVRPYILAAVSSFCVGWMCWCCCDDAVSNCLLAWMGWLISCAFGHFVWPRSVRWTLSNRFCMQKKYADTTQPASETFVIKESDWFAIKEKVTQKYHWYWSHGEGYSLALIQSHTWDFTITFLMSLTRHKIFDFFRQYNFNFHELINLKICLEKSLNLNINIFHNEWFKI